MLLPALLQGPFRATTVRQSHRLRQGVWRSASGGCAFNLGAGTLRGFDLLSGAQAGACATLFTDLDRMFQGTDDRPLLLEQDPLVRLLLFALSGLRLAQGVHVPATPAPTHAFPPCGAANS